MPTMFRQAASLRVLLILLILLTAVIAPLLIEGYLNIGRAQTAYDHKDFSGAARYYESAARMLFWKPDLWEKAALASVSAKDWDRAMPLFEKARARGALSATGWDLFGTGYWIRSQDQQALDVWSTGLEQYPTQVKFYSRLALAYRGLRNYSAERQALGVWLATGQGSALEQYEHALLIMASEPDRALQDLSRASSMDPAFDGVVETLRASLSLAMLETDDSRRLVIMGRGLGLVDQWGLAAQVFEQAVNADQQNADAWAWLGEARQQTDQDGREDLDKALSLDPNSTVVHALRGFYWKRHGQYASMLGEYRQAARLEPENPEWQLSLGDAYTLTGDLVSALAAYQKATTLAPNNATDWRLLAMFSADNAVQVPDVGLPAALKAAKLAPKDPQVLDALGWSYAQAGLLYNAEQTLVEATALAPDLALAHLHLAETYLRKGNQTSAYAQLNLARQLDADGPVGKLAAGLLAQYFP